MKNLLLVSCVLFCLLSHASVESIKGQVSEKNGTPMRYVTVTLSQKSTVLKTTASDVNGRFVFYGLSAGSYDLTYKFIGFSTQKNSVTISDSKQTLILNVQLLPAEQKLQEVVSIVGTKKNSELAVGYTSPTTTSIAADEITYTWSKIDRRVSNGVSATSQTKPFAASTGKAMANQYYYKDMEKALLPDMIIDDTKPDQLTDVVSNTEDYAKFTENKFISAQENSVSTFSIDVDNASYTNVRRMIAYNQMPPRDAVRIEEMINYFKYDYAAPTGEDPFDVNTEMIACPWNTNSKLLLIGMQGKQLDYNQINPSNLVFLVDVSGSMSQPNKLPLVKQSLKLLVANLRTTDKICLVAYAGAAGLVLPSTAVSNKEEIYNAIDNLSSGGSTAGGAGIKLAYKIAEENLIIGGNNRVVMCTDGDFNVGTSSDEEMKNLIVSERDKKIYITMLGFGMGNYKDSKMETIADNGNGNYFYIDNINEATKVFQTDMKATLFTIAKDVKLQLYFNPEKIASYRLVGYENRLLAKEDFDNDKKDAGELGAGHTVTALYEIVLKNDIPRALPLNANSNEELATEGINFLANDYLVLKMRYKKPDQDISKLLINHINPINTVENSGPTKNISFAASVALFGMLLRGSSYTNQASYSDVVALAESAKGTDKEGYRQEFIAMVKSVNLLAKK